MLNRAIVLFLCAILFDGAGWSSRCCLAEAADFLCLEIELKQMNSKAMAQASI